ncbi:hypothetical protein M7775_18160 [Sporomusa sphaeroides DSM 2875]|uniref:hypothetical protein n=1 Tax=Sporomusa sphaeroides TaxID=47679 RepID=UPI00203062D9|nr:hypothetical protein [Sporomusa sphaeroides]MCM0760481.1 hypothetical protein [Sporomusa sphaeroides DSM 2875]
MRDWKKRPPRLRQRLKAWGQEYRQSGKICRACTADWCEVTDTNGTRINPICKNRSDK